MKQTPTQTNRGVTLNGNRLLTTDEAAQLWGISKWSIYGFVKAGKLKPVIGMKSWRFLASDIDGVLERL